MIGAGRGEFDVNIQSQTNRLYRYFLMEELKTDITLTSPVTTGDTVFNVSSGHGFVGAGINSGELLVIRRGDLFQQLRVKAVSTDAITIESFASADYPVSGTSIMRGGYFMNVNGSVTPRTFKFSFNGDTAAITPIDIQSIVLTFQSSTVPDDGRFGGIAAGTVVNGLFFQKHDTLHVNLGNYLNNQEFRDIGGEVVYTDKAPSSEYATNIFLPIQEIFGQVLRLDPRDTPDEFMGIVRDNGTGNTKFTVTLLGSFTSGE